LLFFVVSTDQAPASESLLLEFSN